MAPKPGKHTPYFELVDAQSMAGCPICRLVYKATDRYLDALLYEAVLDPTVRDTLKELLQTLGGARVRSRRLLSWGARRASSPTAERLSAARPCPACEIAATTERDYVSLLLAHLSDDALYAAYVAGEGLCLPHLVAAVRGARDADTLRRLVEPQAARYEHMLGELDEFIRKHDHRFADEKYGEEGDVWLRVMNAVVGGAGRGLSAKSGGRRSNDIGR